MAGACNTFGLFLLVSILLLACDTKDSKPESVAENTEELYNEKWRPQYHFSPPTQWMNDPNGMFYYEGEYHLFYQHYPDSNVWGPMHWGHAVSTDMIHWENMPIALFPDTLGYIFSGSAVVDWNNTSGLGADSHPAIVAIYTYHDPVGAGKGVTTFQTQGIAYSLDKGRTWTKYEGNPVLGNPGIIDFRDPKVTWMDDYDTWVMTLAVKDHIEFYSSPDLINWSKLSEFGQDMGAHGGVWECPDLFKLKDQSTGESKWILLVSINPGGPQGGSATQYFTGYFDGTASTPDEVSSEIRLIDYGSDNYAGVTWSDIPENDGRRLFIGWMSNWLYANIVPTTVWRSAMTLPRELILDNNMVKSLPADELKALEKDPIELEVNRPHRLPGDLVKVEIKPLKSGSFSIDLGNSETKQSIQVSYADNAVYVDRRNAGVSGFHDKFPAKHLSAQILDGPPHLLIYIDKSSVEVFANEGQIVMTDIFFPEKPLDTIQITGMDEGGKVTVTPLSSIW
jgi:fructan beta-fructosidase